MVGQYVIVGWKLFPDRILVARHNDVSCEWHHLHVATDGALELLVFFQGVGVFVVVVTAARWHNRVPIPLTACWGNKNLVGHLGLRHKKHAYSQNVEPRKKRMQCIHLMPLFFWGGSSSLAIHIAFSSITFTFPSSPHLLFVCLSVFCHHVFIYSFSHHRPNKPFE